MSKTRAELIEKAIANLGVLAPGQSPSAEDTFKMDSVVGPAMEELNGLSIYYVADYGSLGPTGGAFEDAAFLSLADYLANAACVSFNLGADTKLVALSQIAEGKLKTLASPASGRRTLRIETALQPRRVGYYRG